MIALHQKHIESLVELTVIQRKELRALVEKLPQLREELISEFEKQLETLEPQIRSEFQQFVLDKIGENKAEANAVLEQKLAELTDKVELAANDKYDAIEKQTEDSRRFIGELSARIATQEKMLPEVVRTITDSRIAAFEAEQRNKPLEFEIPEPQGFNPRGVWDANETYERLDVVSYRGSSYVANERSRGERPSGKSRFWTQLAARAVGGGVAEGGGGATNTWTGFYFVDAVKGVDASGEANNPGKPYKTVFAAIQAAPAGSIVYLFPGTHTIAQGQNLAKDNITLFIGPASTLSYNNTANRTTALFDTTGSMTMRILGGGNIVVTNASTWNTGNHASGNGRRGTIVSFDGDSSYLKLDIGTLEYVTDTAQDSAIAIRIGVNAEHQRTMDAKIDWIYPRSRGTAFGIAGTTVATINRFIGDGVATALLGIGRGFHSFIVGTQWNQNGNRLIRTLWSSNQCDISMQVGRMREGTILDAVSNYNILQVSVSTGVIDNTIGLVNGTSAINQLNFSLNCNSSDYVGVAGFDFIADTRTHVYNISNARIVGNTTRCIAFPAGSNNKTLILRNSMLTNSAGNSLVNSSVNNPIVRVYGTALFKQATSGTFTYQGATPIVDGTIP